MGIEFRIGPAMVGPDHPTYFIADIAANHDGDLERAKYLMTLAKEAGADCAKFQHFRAEHIVCDVGFRSLGSQQDHQARACHGSGLPSWLPTASTSESNSCRLRTTSRQSRT